MPTGGLSLALVAGFLFCDAMPYGGAAAAFKEITPNRMRGQVSAIYLFWLNLAGIGFGSTIVAPTTEHVFGGDLGVSRAIATVAGMPLHYRQSRSPYASRPIAARSPTS